MMVIYLPSGPTSGVGQNRHGVDDTEGKTCGVSPWSWAVTNVDLDWLYISDSDTLPDTNHQYWQYPGSLPHFQKPVLAVPRFGTTFPDTSTPVR
jgi:hypothetical protein